VEYGKTSTAPDSLHRGTEGFPQIEESPWKGKRRFSYLGMNTGIEMMQFWIVRASLEPHLGIMKFSASAEKILSKEFLAWRD